jgi:hypothetical protein
MVSRTFVGDDPMNPLSRFLTVLAAAALVLSLASGVAAAQSDELKAEEKAQFDKRMFGKEPAPKATTYACFVRRYDADHLARHPHQKVTSMKLLFTSELFEGNTELERHFRLGVTFRHKRGAYDSSGSCNHFRPENAKDEIRFGCGVDCDGGGISIGMGKEDKSVIVRLSRVRIWQNNKPDEEAGDELVAGKDDAIFRLDRAELEDCRSLVTDRKELAAMRAVSNRK